MQSYRRKWSSREDDNPGTVFDAWYEYKRCRNETVSKIFDALEQHEKKNMDATITKAVGSTSLIGGSGLALVGFLSSVLTGGTSLSLVAIGAGIGAAGGVTVTASSFISDLRRTLSGSDVAAALEADRCSVKRLLSALRRAGARVKEGEASEVLSHRRRATRNVDLVAGAGLRAYRAALPGHGGRREREEEAWIIEVPLNLNELLIDSLQNKLTTEKEVAKAIAYLAEAIECPRDWDVWRSGTYKEAALKTRPLIDQPRLYTID